MEKIQGQQTVQQQKDPKLSKKEKKELDYFG